MSKFDVFAMRGLLDQFTEIIFQKFHKCAFCHSVVLDDDGGKFVRFKLEFDNKSTGKKGK